MGYREEFNRWCKFADADQDVIIELKQMSDAQIEDAFYRNGRKECNDRIKEQN